MSELTSWAYLSRVVEGPNLHLQALLRAGRDADEIARGIRTRASWLGGLAGATEARYRNDRSQQDLIDAAEQGYTLITPDSGVWPTEAIAQSFGIVGDIHQDRGCQPHALWVRGETNLPALLERSVGIVGTRAATGYGESATADLVRGLAARQYTIVSGGALGIDTVAHETALASSVPTIVIAACGPGVTYPRRNERLFDRVAQHGGALICEYPPGVTPDRHRFLTRNRLIAALTQGTVIVEAAYRSGALNTMTWVSEFHRQAMAVPGSILSQNSLGTNLAIADGRATMVLNAEQIHELLSPVGDVDAQLTLEAMYKPSPLQQLSHNELRVYDSLPPIGAGGLQAEAVAEAAGFSVGLTVHLLMDLEERRLVRRDRRLWERTELEGHDTNGAEV